MNGTGNDFVILDARKAPIALTPEQVRRIAARNNPATRGCDQLIVMEPAREAEAFMRIYNADGSEVAACGNATRCVAWRLMQESGRDQAVIRTLAGRLPATRAGEAMVRVDMDTPNLGWQSVARVPAYKLGRLLAFTGLGEPFLVSMGNPHAVFFVSDVQAVDLARLGPMIEQNPVFPERVNVSIAQVRDAAHIDLRVWERGAGLTLACGTAACAALVAAAATGLSSREAEIALPGGTLRVEWDEKTGHVFMTGAVQMEFEGELRL